MSELWREVPGYPWYKVSNKGKVKSVARTILVTRSDTGVTYELTRKSYLLKPAILKRGCLQVLLSHSTKPAKHFYVHQLVALAFLPKRKKHHYLVMHKDDNPGNNKPNNLKWGTDLDNSNDKLSKNRQTRGSDIVHAVFTESIVRRIDKLINSGYRNFEIAEIYGVSNTTISNIRTGRTWSHLFKSTGEE